MHYVFLWDVLGPYLSAEAGGVIGRRFKRKTLPQTATDGNFEDFIVTLAVF